MTARECTVADRTRPARAQKAARRAGADGYERKHALPRLLAIADSELAPDNPEMSQKIIARLARALRSERQRGRAGHWTYDLNRHIALAQAIDAERRQLGALRGARWSPLPDNQKKAGINLDRGSVFPFRNGRGISVGRVGKQA